ncbi:tetratricopeptide repeat protein [Azospirillum sp. B506]|uniref:tetratricopeptide repeat protein n=1 Tax=Azospirillum sp. B506 TaxID=137721 RepID=UPI0003469DAA|nr:tetratricopeptide repeat protein [Azospirillum sp. B506]
MATTGDVLRLAADHHGAGRLEEAMALYRLLLRADPVNADGWRLLGKAVAKAGDRRTGLACLRRLIALCPADATAFAEYAALLVDQGEEAGAVAVYGVALRCDPLMAQVAFQHGMLLYRQGALKQAEVAFRTVALLVPDLAMAHINRGAVLHAQGAQEAAERSLAHGRRLAPETVEAALNSALVAMAQGRLPDVERHGGRVIVLAPDSVQGYALVANARVHRGRPQNGIALYDRALHMEPDNTGLRVNRGVARLLLGEMAGGWDDLAAHWQSTAPPGGGEDGPPRWSGAAIAAGRLLVVGQPGVGDEILFASLIPELAETGIACRLACDPRLVPLLRRSLPGTEVVARADGPSALAAPGSGADSVAQVRASDLPRYLRRRPEDFARQRPYLAADRHKVAALRARHGDARLCIGISWRSVASEARSLGLEQLAAALAPGLAAAGGRLINLQYGADDRERCLAGLFHEPDIDPSGDLDGFAALVAAMDLVITIDNTTAHIAGGLGVPGWVLLPFMPAWFWGLRGPATPWYPSLRLFRQAIPGDWSGVLAEVAEALRPIGGTRQ